MRSEAMSALDLAFQSVKVVKRNIAVELTFSAQIFPRATDISIYNLVYTGRYDNFRAQRL